jgi:hypothetical protein
MTQALYAHMNNKKNKIKSLDTIKKKRSATIRPCHAFFPVACVSSIIFCFDLWSSALVVNVQCTRREVLRNGKATQ